MQSCNHCVCIRVCACTLNGAVRRCDCVNLPSSSKPIYLPSNNTLIVHLLQVNEFQVYFPLWFYLKRNHPTGC